MNKITQRDYYKAILTRLNGETSEISDDDIISFIDGRIALLDKKSANRKPTKTQEENEGLKSIITSVLSTEGKTPSEIIASTTELAGLTPQKVSPLCYQLVADGVAKKITDKKRSLFALA